MIKKGILNINIGNCVNEHFAGDATAGKNNCFKKHNHRDLYSLIVNRWYYGLFLMAKACVGCKDSDIRHCDRNLPDGTQELGVWSLLEKQNPTFDRISKMGEDLYNYRNRLDYDNATASDAKVTFDLAYDLFPELYSILEKLTSEKTKTQGS